MYVIHTPNHNIFAYHAGEHNLSTYSKTPLIRTLFIRIVNFPGRFGLTGESVENSTKLTSLEITVCRIKYSTVLWLIELQFRRGRKVYTQVHIINSNSRTSNCQCSLFKKKNPIIRISCISGWLAVHLIRINVVLLYFEKHANRLRDAPSTCTHGLQPYKIYFNIILPIMPTCSHSLNPLRFQHQHFALCTASPMSCAPSILSLTLSP